MRKEDFAEVLGDISENYVKEAETIKKTKNPVWLKWGAAAACLCLVVGLAFFTREPSPPPRRDQPRKRRSTPSCDR